MNPISRDGLKLGSSGLPHADVEAKIADLDTGMKELLQGEAKELCLKSPQVMQGYWSNPEEIKNVYCDGKLYPDDIAREDEDGYLLNCRPHAYLPGCFEDNRHRHRSRVHDH